MSGNKNIINYSAADIERYWQGKLSPAEMHAMEKAALEDPFLADAMEGYAGASSVNNDIIALKEKLDQRISTGKVISMPARNNTWWKIAASLVLVAGIAYASYRYTSRNQKQDVAQAKETNTGTKQENSKTGAGNPNDTSSFLHKEAETTNQDKQVIGITSGNTAASNSDDEKSPSPGDSLNYKYFKDVSTAAKEDRSSLANANNRITAAAPHGTEKPGKLLTDSTSVADLSEASKDYLTENAIKTKAENGNGFASLPAVTDKKSSSRKKNSFFKLSGRIVDADNNGIENASILNLINNEITISGNDGYFTVPVDADSLVLLDISSPGYSSREFRLNRYDKKQQELMLYETPVDDSPGDITVSAELNEDYSLKNNNTQNTASAAPVNGWTLFNQYLEKNLTKDKADLSQGEVVLKFTISNAGKPVNIVVVKSVSTANDAEAIRLLKAGPAWISAGKTNDTRISIRFH